MTTLAINNDAAIRVIKAPTTGKVDYRDKGMPGLYLRVSSAGTKTWRLAGRVKGQGRQVIFTLGEYAAGTPQHVNLGAARQLAGQYKAELRQGINPRDRLADEAADQAKVDDYNVVRQERTFAFVRAAYFNSPAFKTLKPNSQKVYRSSLTAPALKGIESRLIDEVTRLTPLNLSGMPALRTCRGTAIHSWISFKIKG
jgi:hypothetical protein